MTLSNDLLLGLLLGAGGTLIVVAVIQLWQRLGRVSKRLTAPGCLITMVISVVVVIVGGMTWQTEPGGALW